MRRNHSARSTLRCAQIERYEDRLVFSGVPWIDACDPLAPDLIGTSPEWVELAPDVDLAGSVTPFSSSLENVRNSYGFYGSGQTVAIIDSGVAWDHVALGGGLGTGFRVVGGWDFTEENDANPYDDGPAGFHGTHVAGIVGAQGNSHSGVAPEVDLVALRVFNDQGYGYTQWVEQALRWVHEHRDDYRFPITTVNLSLGAQWNGEAPPNWATLEDELALLVQDGIFVTAAAGNSYAMYGQPGLAYPAASPNVVPVASVGDDGQLSGFSQRHDRVLASPGEFITSTVPDYILGADGKLDDWAAASGTSMAAPYLAGASVLVREAMQFVGLADISQSSIYTHLRDTADRVFDGDSEAYYHVVNLSHAIDSLLPDDDYSSSLDNPHDLGMLGSSRVVTGQLARLDDRDVFQFTAPVDGQLTWDAVGGEVFELLVGSHGGQLASADSQSSMRVNAGQSYMIVLSAGDQLADYELELSIEADRQVVVDGSTVQVNGTAGNDVIRFWIDDAYRIEVNGHEYQFSLGRDWQFHLAAGGGDDQLNVTGSKYSEEFVLRPGVVSVSAPGYSLVASQFSRITVNAGGGLDDVMRMHGSLGSDTFLASPTGATMSGAGYQNQAHGFDRIYAYAKTGTSDVARLRDSAGNDLFTADQRSAVLQGDGYFIKAWNFERVYAYASTGKDTARLFDSAGDDQFIGTTKSGTMESSQHFVKAWYFDRVYAYARGGNDIARLYDSSGADRFVGTSRAGSLASSVHFLKAWHFDRVYAYAVNGGADSAQLYGSNGNDLLAARAKSSSLEGGGYFFKAWHFERVVAHAGAAGYDVAKFYDSPQSDLFVGGHDRSEMRGQTYFAAAEKFDRVYAIPSADPSADRASLPDANRADEYFAWDDRTTLRVATVQSVLLALDSLEELIGQLAAPAISARVSPGPSIDREPVTDRSMGHHRGAVSPASESDDIFSLPATGAPTATELPPRDRLDFDSSSLDHLGGLIDDAFLDSVDELLLDEGSETRVEW